MSIRPFRCRDTNVWLDGERIGKCVRTAKAAMRKFAIFNAASELEGRRVPPVNRPEALHGDSAGQHSIRVDDQHRVCFTWTGGGPANVEIVGYH